MNDDAYRPDPAASPDRFWCTLCKRAYPGAGSCPTHAEEPLLDMGDDEVLLMLEEQDHRMYWQRAGVYMGIAAAVAIVVTVAVSMFFDRLDVKGPNPLLMFGGISVGGTFLLLTVLPPPKTAPVLTDGQKAALAQARARERT